MRRTLRLVVAAFWLLVLCIPLAGVLTIALLPLWSYLEATRGVESVGHSGPAAWCYAAVYVGTVIVAATTLTWMGRTKPS